MERMETRLVGQTLAGRYDLIELLGTGGMGEVYRARDRELDELVALKVIRADLASAPEIVARFRHEVKLARRVTHANVRASGRSRSPRPWRSPTRCARRCAPRTPPT